MNKYLVSGSVPVTVWFDVYADSESEAREKAVDEIRDHLNIPTDKFSATITDDDLEVTKLYQTP